MARNGRHVVPNASGGWVVKKPHSTRASSRHETQAEAEAAAKRSLAHHGGGEAIIHRPNGQIRDSDTVRPGNDPNPPKDARH